MNAKMKLNLALLGVVAVLGLLLAWNPGHQETEAVPLARLDPQTVTKIQISGRQNLVLEKRDGHWRLTQPLDVPANEFRVEQLLQIPKADSDARYPVDPAQLARYQLAPPNASLKLNDLTLEFGGTEPIQSRRYVKVGDTLHLVADSFYQHLTAVPTDYVEKKLLPDNAQIQAIQLPGLALSKTPEGGWRAEPAQDNTAALQEMADAWKSARAYDVQTYTPPKDGKPLDAAKISLADGQAIEFKILRREPDAILLRPDWGLQFHLAESIAQPLLRLPKPEKPAEAPAPSH
jgi:hypothetical protein